MTPRLDDFYRPRTIEYLTVDAGLVIQELSSGAPEYAEDPSAVQMGEDVRTGFPEFVGAEEDVTAVCERRIPSFRIRGLQKTNSDGERVFITMTIEPRRSRGGIASAIVRLEDVTESFLLQQKLIQESNEAMLFQEALSVSNLYLEKVLDSIADMLFIISVEGRIQTANKAALDALGYDSVDVVNTPLDRICTDEILFRVVEFAKRDSRGAERIHTVCRARDGREIQVLFSLARIVVDGMPEVILSGKNLQELAEAQDAITYLQEQILEQHNFEEIIANSGVMKAVFRKVEKVAPTDSTILLRGETGTGKELIAHAAHNRSDRKQKPLIIVNCAALPGGLVESELFGHEKGAFTGASSRRIGRFELAKGGTIFLDEVGELPLETQAKLLRVFQERQIERVGGSSTIDVNVRVIAATNRDLEEAVAAGTFREDLFYRLNVFPIRVPPLRDRAEDVPLLTHFFVDKFSRKTTRKITGIASSTMKKIQGYSWPGNVRELANVIERAVILCETVTITDIDLQIPSSGRIPSKTPATLDAVQREHILNVLNDCSGTIEGPDGAASILGVNPATLRSRMKKLGIRRKESRFVSSSKS